MTTHKVTLEVKIDGEREVAYTWERESHGSAVKLAKDLSSLMLVMLRAAELIEGSVSER